MHVTAICGFEFLQCICVSYCGNGNGLTFGESLIIFFYSETGQQPINFQTRGSQAVVKMSYVQWGVTTLCT
jgi:hypothetical protein